MSIPKPIQVAAKCTTAQSEKLIWFDHHRVKVGERWGIMITYHWMAEKEAKEYFVVKVVFNPSPLHLPTEDAARVVVFQHPAAPQDVQEIIDQLEFSDAPV